MDVKVLGTGCAKCKTLYAETEAALRATGVVATLTKVERFDEILAHGVMMTPALVIDGAVTCTGRVPRKAELEGWLRAAASKQA